MKKLTRKHVVLIKGSGCKKYLRRYHRAMKDGNEVAALGNLTLYMDCTFT